MFRRKGFKKKTRSLAVHLFFATRKMTFLWFCCQILFVVWKCSLEHWSSNKSKNYYSSLNHWCLLSSTTSLPIWNGRREDNLIDITSTNFKSTELSWSILVPINILHNSYFFADLFNLSIARYKCGNVRHRQNTWPKW